ncbi:aldose 1-epimerase family protein [Fluviicola sp.]|uniref:aldose 1-epimerase family protein n=1 Tax=Fluviicola sp. TaxID=1917219 RepID=UPI003D2DCA99
MDKIIQLTENTLQASIATKGAELLFLGTESSGNILWSKQTDHWNRVAPNLFPIVGRLVNDSFTVQEISYSMTQHGFARDKEFEVIEQTESSVRLRLVSTPESMDVYPYSFVFDVCFSLSESGITITYETTNKGKETMYYSVGGHPAFQLDEPLENYFLEFDEAIQLEREDLAGGYFTGETQYYGVSTHLNLSDELFESDAFVLKSPHFRYVCLKHVDGKTLVQMNCDSWTAVGFWTKKGAPFICIEPWWGWADNVHSTGKLEEKAGIRILEPGSKELLTYSIHLRGSQN